MYDGRMHDDSTDEDHGDADADGGDDHNSSSQEAASEAMPLYMTLYGLNVQCTDRLAESERLDLRRTLGE